MQIPPEPYWIIEEFQELWNAAQSDGYGDRLMLGYWVNTGGGNEVESYLWKTWKDDLEPLGVNWNDLISIRSNFGREYWHDVRLNSVLFRWMKGESSWETVAAAYISGIEDRIKKAELILVA